MSGKFIKNKKYYSGIVHEWNIPTGTTCPFALECKVSVDRYTGKFDIKRGQYKCYAASSERFPAVREHRWNNFELVKKNIEPTIPKDCTAIRIHMSGDFFNQDYFDMWLRIAEKHWWIEMWSYTKSLRYWINRLNDIPPNLILTASRGGREDFLIDEYQLKNVIVCDSIKSVPPDRPVDNNDDFARVPKINFALLDNNKNNKKNTDVELHNQNFQRGIKE